MHSSLSFLVSGQAQQIFFFGFESVPEAKAVVFWSFSACAEMTVDDLWSGIPPIVSRPHYNIHVKTRD